MVAFTDSFKDVIIQILHTVKLHVKEPYIPDFISEVISGAISVAYLIVSFFWDFLPEKEVFSDTESDESCK